MSRYPVIDSFKLNISNLHFGKKVRGKFGKDTDIYDKKVHGSIENFLKDKVLTRRKCTSFVYRLYDFKPTVV